jgi:hypothetical protein
MQNCFLDIVTLKMGLNVAIVVSLCEIQRIPTSIRNMHIHEGQDEEAGGVPQAVECLFCKCEALSSTCRLKAAKLELDPMSLSLCS